MRLEIHIFLTLLFFDGMGILIHLGKYEYQDNLLIIRCFYFGSYAFCIVLAKFFVTLMGIYIRLRIAGSMTGIVGDENPGHIRETKLNWMLIN